MSHCISNTQLKVVPAHPIYSKKLKRGRSDVLVNFGMPKRVRSIISDYLKPDAPKAITHKPEKLIIELMSSDLSEPISKVSARLLRQISPSLQQKMGDAFLNVLGGTLCFDPSEDSMSLTEMQIDPEKKLLLRSRCIIAAIATAYMFAKRLPSEWLPNVISELHQGLSEDCIAARDERYRHIKVLSALEDSRAKLNKIRSDLLHKTGVVDNIPIDDQVDICDTINAYLGVEKEENVVKPIELQLSALLGDDFNTDKLYQALLADVPPSLRGQMSRSLYSNIVISLLSDPHLRRMSCIEAQNDPLSNLQFRVKCVEATILTAKHYSKLFPSGWMKSVISALHQQLVEDHVSVMHELYGNKQILLKADREHIIQWTRHVLALQKKCSPLIDPPVFEEGQSHGFTFVIKKNDRIYGYLYGTIHQLDLFSEKEREKILSLSQNTRIRLNECAILGTEIARNPKYLSKLSTCYSVDQTLMSCATRWAIPNIGIDDEVRNTLPRLETYGKEVMTQFKILFEKYGQHMSSAYCSGDAEKMRCIYSDLDDDNLALNATMSKRNQTMADNIDFLLNTCDKAAKEMSASPIKCFFAIGTAHLLSTKALPDSVVELLKKKGWTVE